MTKKMCDEHFDDYDKEILKQALEDWFRNAAPTEYTKLEELKIKMWVDALDRHLDVRFNLLAFIADRKIGGECIRRAV